MKNSRKNNELSVIDHDYLYLFFISFGSLIATFLISSSEVSYQNKFVVFILIVIVFLLLCFRFYIQGNKRVSVEPKFEREASVISPGVEPTLQVLEEANEFFGAVLKPADMFRLAASRLKDVIPFAACAFYLVAENEEKLKIVYSAGENIKELAGTEFSAKKGLAGKIFQSRKPMLDQALAFDKNIFPSGALANFTSAIGIPLFRNDDIFGIFVLYGDGAEKFNENSLQIFEAVGSRIAPLFVSSQSFENSLNTALTDGLTNLPNERAFFLVLENQIAESLRFRDERSLTILVIDIQGFTDLNQKYGHSYGDRLLLFVSEKIKHQLRQMDFLARSFSDEFLVILPTASEEIAREVIGRIEKTFVTNPFEVSEMEKISLQLSFGYASFGKDGETANQLLNHAKLRKKQSKSVAAQSNVLWFPKEFVN